MSDPAAPDSRAALAAAVLCYAFWGLVPLFFLLISRMGAGPLEIMGHRTLWALPAALLLVLFASQASEVARVLRERRTMLWLAASSVLIVVNWLTFTWAVTENRILETSLGYYLNPLLNMAAGAVLFRERMDGFGKAAIGLAAVGVVLQAVAIGHLPFVSLILAFSFCAYGIVRKRVAASAQTGLFVECLYFLPFSLAYIWWLEQSGGGHFLQGLTLPLLLALGGPVTAIPLALFSWAARRLPYSTMGFIQFLAPTISFFVGVASGESFTPLRALSFGFIWAGAAVFAWGAWRALRKRTDDARAESHAAAGGEIDGEIVKAEVK